MSKVKNKYIPLLKEYGFELITNELVVECPELQTFTGYVLSYKCSIDGCFYHNIVKIDGSLVILATEPSVYAQEFVKFGEKSSSLVEQLREKEMLIN
jgi:hypothetical protein